MPVMVVLQDSGPVVNEPLLRIFHVADDLAVFDGHLLVRTCILQTRHCQLLAGRDQRHQSRHVIFRDQREILDEAVDGHDFGRTRDRVISSQQLLRPAQLLQVAVKNI